MEGLRSASGRVGDVFPGRSRPPSPPAVLWLSSSFCSPKCGLRISLMKKFVTRMGGGATAFTCAKETTTLWPNKRHKMNRETQMRKWVVTNAKFNNHDLKILQLCFSRSSSPKETPKIATTLHTRTNNSRLLWGNFSFRAVAEDRISAFTGECKTLWKVTETEIPTGQFLHQLKSSIQNGLKPDPFPDSRFCLQSCLQQLITRASAQHNQITKQGAARLCINTCLGWKHCQERVCGQSQIWRTYLRLRADGAAGRGGRRRVGRRWGDARGPLLRCRRLPGPARLAAARAARHLHGDEAAHPDRGTAVLLPTAVPLQVNVRILLRRTQVRHRLHSHHLHLCFEVAMSRKKNCPCTKSQQCYLKVSVGVSAAPTTICKCLTCDAGGGCFVSTNTMDRNKVSRTI